MALEILRAGLQTTVQDLGRLGYQKDGIIVSGAMDAFALRTANLLVGNAAGAAGLEVTLQGPAIRFTEDHLIALTGADLSPTVDGETVSLWRPVYVRRGAVLAFGTPLSGCRTYVAVAGSFDLPRVLESYATYLHAGIGGFKGRALQVGDVLPCQAPTAKSSRLIAVLKGKTGSTSSFIQASWGLHPHVYRQEEKDALLIRAMRGPEYDLFSEESKAAFWKQPFLVTPQSDRMGYRLQGSRLSLAAVKEQLSSAVTFGTVQVPAGGSPIVLGADHQTTGGYPRIAQVITADFSVLAQLVPGEKIRFQEVSLEEGQQLYMAQVQKLEQLKSALALKIL